MNCLLVSLKMYSLGNVFHASAAQREDNYCNGRRR